MEHIFEFTYGIFCLTATAMMVAVFHYFMQRRITGSPAINHHSELMMVLCLFMAIAITVLVAIPYYLVLGY